MMRWRRTKRLGRRPTDDTEDGDERRWDDDEDREEDEAEDVEDDLTSYVGHDGGDAGL